MKKEEHIYISAIRYALGRMTYIVSDTVEFMLNVVFTEQAKEVILRDIYDALQSGNYGMLQDKAEWEKLKNYLELPVNIQKV